MPMAFWGIYQVIVVILMLNLLIAIMVSRFRNMKKKNICFNLGRTTTSTVFGQLRIWSGSTVKVSTRCNTFLSTHVSIPCISYPRPSSFLRGQLFHLPSLGFTTSPEQSTGAREVVLSQPRRWRRRRNTSGFWRSWFWSRSGKNTNRRPTTRWRAWGGTSGTTCWNGRRKMAICDEPKAWRLLKGQTRLKATVQSNWSKYVI